MAYEAYMKESISRVEESRQKRLTEIHARLTAEQIDELLHGFHPDYKKGAIRPLKIGPSKGENVLNEVADMIESHSRIDPDNFDLSKPDYDCDVLVVGGGGAGASAALLAQEKGAKVLLVTKLRFGDANTMMAQGGIQAADKANDSPAIHYIDVMGGGHFNNHPELVRALVTDAPEIIKWHEDLGVMYDKDKEGTMQTIHGGGTSRKRMHAARDYSGAEIMRVLRDEVTNRNIPVIEFSPVVELVVDEEGRCAGAIIYNIETKEYFLIKANATIIATGGFGRLHVQSFPTTNHYGATADGIVLAYRVGAGVAFMDTAQYHPTGVAYPEQILGLLITEKVRGVGAQLVNKDGEQFIYPLETRDVVASGIIRECWARNKGIETPSGVKAVWLDTPMIEQLKGSGAILKELPAMYRQFMRFGIDMTKEPVLTFPTLHYQNGGIIINDRCETTVPGLYVAGEASGGIHGRNRLMGNSLLDVNVFGRRAGINAAEYAKKAKVGKLTLKHVKANEAQLAAAKIETKRVAPILLPDYRKQETLQRQEGIDIEGLGAE